MFTITAVRQLLKYNLEVELLCIDNSTMHKKAIEAGIVVHAINISGYSKLSAVSKIAALIKNRKFNVVHSQASKDLWFLVPALKFCGSRIPLFFTKQVQSYIIKKDFLHRAIYKRVTLAFAISNAVKENMIFSTPLLPSKIQLLYNGVDTEIFSPSTADRTKIRGEFGFSEREIVCGMVARLSPGKGHEDLLWAASVLNKKYDNLKFLIVGEASYGEDSYADSIKKLAQNYGLHNIIFAGFRESKEMFDAMDIFVFPSHGEALGIALIEALSMGKPAVASNEGGVLDIVVNNETSLLFENKNKEDLAKKLEILIKDDSLRTRFAAASRKRIIENFDLEELTKRVIDIYTSFV